MTHCSPTHYANHPKRGTCLSDLDVHAVAQAILPARARPVTAVGMLLALHATLGTRPGDEEAWLEHARIRADVGLRARLESAFRPAHPSAWLRDPHAWLSNLDIQAVMQQYEALLMKTHGFRFMGVVPRDFEARSAGASSACVSDAICRTHVADLWRQGVRKFGIVFNLDKHTEQGSHWTSMFVGIDPSETLGDRYGAFYYDSLGRPPPAEMRRFAARMRRECNQLGAGRAFRVQHNSVRKQYANTECGIYSMFFIVACVQSGRSIADICKRLVRGDKEMHRLRAVMFRPPVAHSHAGGSR